MSEDDDADTLAVYPVRGTIGPLMARGLRARVDVAAGLLMRDDWAEAAEGLRDLARHCSGLAVDADSQRRREDAARRARGDS